MVAAVVHRLPFPLSPGRPSVARCRVSDARNRCKSAILDHERDGIGPMCDGTGPLEPGYPTGVSSPSVSPELERLRVALAEARERGEPFASAWSAAVASLL